MCAHMGAALYTGLKAAGSRSEAIDVREGMRKKKKGNSTPLVSVIVPAYNGAETVLSSVESVVRQTYRPIELIVIDDSSFDATYENLCSYKEELRADLLKVFRHDENVGLAATLNHGLKESRGEYVLVLHQDCELIGNDWITKSLKYFSNDRIAVVTGYYGIPPENLSFVVKAFGVLRKQYHLLRSDVSVEEITFSEGKCDVYRRDVLEKIGGFPERYKIAGEDLVVSYNLRREGYILLKAYDLPVVQRFGHTASNFLGNFRKEFTFGKAMGGVFLQFKSFVFKGLASSSYAKSRALHRAGQPFYIGLLLLLATLSTLTGSQPIVYVTFLMLVFRYLYYVIRVYGELRNLSSVSNKSSKHPLLESAIIAILGFPTDLLYTSGFVYGLILYQKGVRP